MSDLRNNLNDLKRDYESLKYPGDLAADVLDENPRSVLFRIGPVLAMAAAITVAATVWIMRPADPEAEVIEVATGRPPTGVMTTGEPDAPVAQSIIATMPQTQTESFASPGWSDVSGASMSSVSMPYQSLAMPSMTEIDASITAAEQVESDGAEQG
jgi:hypothetical protein